MNERQILYRGKMIDGGMFVESRSIDYLQSGKVFLKQYIGTWPRWVEVDPRSITMRNVFAQPIQGKEQRRNAPSSPKLKL